MKIKLLVVLFFVYSFSAYSEEANFVFHNTEIHNTKTLLENGCIVYAECNLKLRASAGLNSSTITKLVAGEKITISEVGNEEEIDGIRSNWIKVYNETKQGWCFGGYVSALTVIKPGLFQNSYSLDSENEISMSGKTSFILHDYDSEEIYFHIDNCYKASETDYVDKWYPYVFFVSLINNYLYIFDIQEGTILPCIPIENGPVRYTMITPNKKYILYSCSDKGIYETKATQNIYICEIRTQRLVSHISKYCLEQGYVHYYFNKTPDGLRVCIDEESGGDGISHTFYFNQDTGTITYDEDWNSKWSD